MNWLLYRQTPVVLKELVQGLTIAILLGVSFTALQAQESNHSAFGHSGNIHGASLSIATGFHGAHANIGSVFLFVCLMRTLKGRFTPTAHIGIGTAVWYWHLVDVVWLFLFAAANIWGG